MKQSYLKITLNFMIWPGILGMATEIKSITDILKIYLYIYMQNMKYTYFSITV